MRRWDAHRGFARICCDPCRQDEPGCLRFAGKGKAMKWKKEFSVGIHEIDEQHKTLSDCIESVEQAVVGRERWSAVHSAFIRLEEFARIHFAVEESLMRIHDYPGLEEHIHEHWQFSDNLKRLKEKSLTADVSQEMIAFIRAWLDQHVITSDKRYALHFLKRMV
jgi:hemerythrin